MTDEDFMQMALEQAHLAKAHHEVPVGAVLVLNDQVIARAHNQNITLADSSAHAEIQVLRAAGQQLANHRLTGAKLYVTLEPCLMCVGAMVHARIAQVVFAASDPKTGACGSCINAHELEFHNHFLQVRGGILADECSRLLKDFFKARRE